MNDTVLMCCSQTFYQLQANANYILFCQLTGGDLGVERYSGNEFRHEEIDAILAIKIVHGSYVGMVKPGKRQCLFPKPVTRTLVSECAKWQELDCYITFQALVMCAKDQAHSARADLLQNSVVS